MQSRASTVAQYLAALPPDRRATINAVRSTILNSIDPAFKEGMQYGMIGYFLPHSAYPPGYHCDPKQPLPFAGLAAQKQHLSLYIMALYVGPSAAGLSRWFNAAWGDAVAAGRARKLDMGKACIRFRSLEDIPLDVIAEAFRRTTAAAYVKTYEAQLAASGRTTRSTSASTKMPTKKPSPVRATRQPAESATSPAARKRSAASRRRATA